MNMQRYGYSDKSARRQSGYAYLKSKNSPAGLEKIILFKKILFLCLISAIFFVI